MKDFLAAHWGVCALWVLFASCIDFTLMGVDKRKARRGDWRIPEATLWAFALAGGGPGGALGMRAFHHKTRHWQFKYGFPLVAAVEIGLLFWLLL